MPGSRHLLHAFSCAFCLLWLVACGPTQPTEGPQGEVMASVEIDIRKEYAGMLVFRLAETGLSWCIMNETQPAKVGHEDIPVLVVQYAASRKEKGMPEVYDIDADEDFPTPEIDKLMRALRAAGVEKFTLSSGMLEND